MAEETEGKANELVIQKYALLMNAITTLETRLFRTEMCYMFLNVFVFLASTISVGRLHLFGYPFTLFWLIIGMLLCAYWIASAMRLQLKLMLRYFQARYLERQLEASGGILSDEGSFFNPSIRRLESPDGKETLRYPTKGLTALDGFVGAAKPRYLSWILPSFFFILYLLTWGYLFFYRDF